MSSEFSLEMLQLLVLEFFPVPESAVKQYTFFVGV